MIKAFYDKSNNYSVPKPQGCERVEEYVETGFWCVIALIYGSYLNQKFTFSV